MAAPEILRPQLNLVEPRIRDVIASVATARFGFQTDESVGRLTVGEAIGAVETATKNWFEVADSLELAIDQNIEAMLAEIADQSTVAQFDAQSELRATQSALMLLHIAVMNEIALLQPLEFEDEDRLLRDVEGWPNDGRAELERIALDGRGLVYLLFAGTDDDDGDGPEKDDGAGRGGSDDSSAEVDAVLIQEVQAT